MANVAVIQCDTCASLIENPTLENLFETYQLYKNGTLGDQAFMGHLYKIFASAPYTEVTDVFDSDEAVTLGKPSIIL